MRKLSTAIAALATLTLAAPASAADWIDFTGWTGTTSVGGAHTFSDGTVNVRVTAWSRDTNDIIHAAPLSGWSGGLYIQNSDDDNSHTVDNSGWDDFLLFQFDQSVELIKAGFNTGWYENGRNPDYINDSDATIGFDTVGLPYTSQPAWDGVSDSVLAGMGLYSSDHGNGDNTRFINPEHEVGNFWLIGAAFEDQFNDGFKLTGLKYSVAPPPPPGVPEPGTWLMMILGFGLVGGVMRREKRKGAPALA